MLTPPDVVTQIMMALPLMVMYELSIIGARFFGKKKHEPEEDEAEQGAA
jgi:sec-independent protein translocase protein TatC